LFPYLGIYLSAHRNRPLCALWGVYCQGIVTCHSSKMMLGQLVVGRVGLPDDKFLIVFSGSSLLVVWFLHVDGEGGTVVEGAVDADTEGDGLFVNFS